jgi:hypothetical protein
MKLFDLTSAFDNITNYRFQPNIAGYYQFDGVLRLGTSSITAMYAELWKNGVTYSRGQEYNGAAINGVQVIISDLIYLNGSTDYIELYGYVTATTPIFAYVSGTITSKLSGFLVRAT